MIFKQFCNYIILIKYQKPVCSRFSCFVFNISWILKVKLSNNNWFFALSSCYKEKQINERNEITE